VGRDLDEKDVPGMPAEYKNVELVKCKQGEVSKIHIGGIEMMKIKLLTTVLIVLAAVGIVTAAEVINVDIKSYGDNTPYVGNGAYDVGNGAVWIPYSGGWAVPVGSARSEGLTPPVPELNQYLSSIYAAQVWIGDNGLIHGYQSGTGLMDDGFTATSPNEPNISIFGEGAYTGLYDIYVYGNDDGNFILDQNGVKDTRHVTGGVASGTFVEGGNYVIFTDVNVISSDFSKLYLTYTNKLNALQFVKKKSPFVIEPNSLGLIRIPAGDWDVAGDRNTRTTESNRYGPDTFYDDVNGIGSYVGYLDTGEFMDYDINVDDANKGQYQICLGIFGNTTYGYIPAGEVRILLDDVNLGDVNRLSSDIVPTGSLGDTTSVTANLYPGNHTLRWLLYYGSGNSGFSLAYVKFTRIGNISEGWENLDLWANDWLLCNNPDPNGCL